MKVINVVAAVLVDDQDRILLAQRPQGKWLAGLWEFPGGKLEEGETPEACLVRELHEELGITLDERDLTPLTFVSHPYPEKSFHLVMLVYTCRNWLGEARGLEDQALAWVARHALQSYDMPPADVPIVAVLQGES
jgi:8-oxo-dGTP diphosphatase